ncbi:LOW QUALITY PROTEIN: dimethylaniline monooxygenase [N-oxide-forming] 4 [Monodelphis domestica]|uniref:LOW QUALITY PROTEIN: dimethylaniline monooxygenase [N-oxide-forming] 4 n=1 Tax=Monodelphis domestica TaxID=13616 RepID=UPI0024E1DBA2|nr:LOW QUALITY PROTEIN: dimethylaniline monooxygenase [N-oxide-forming] 4 [Monodelphis domestica]
MAKRVAIIGAGVSGLTSIKCCLEEGLEPTCFERSDDIGGLWKFAENSRHGMTQVYKSVVTNVCKEMTCYSDFPFQEDYPNYVNQAKLLKYLRSYADHFDLLKYIHLKTTVCSVTKRPDFSVSGQWNVVTDKEGKQHTAVFDAVMICTGLYLNPHLPLESFPGINIFQGQTLHSQEYRSPGSFQGKKVLVIGLGNSGGDIAVEVSRVASQVFLSTRSGTWVLSRLSKDGYPLLMILLTRFLHMVSGMLPSPIRNWINDKQFTKWFNHKNYGLSIPKGQTQTLIINDELPSCILCGAITVKANVEEFTETSAIFEDGTVEEDIDVVIFATGYTFSFPFLEEPTRSLCKNKIYLYKHVFPSNLEKPTMAIMGHISIKGAILPAVELQGRWVTRVFKGLCKIPPTNQLMADATRKEDLVKRGIIQDPRNEKLDYIDFLDELARYIGAKPRILSLFLKDPRLGKEVFFGPCTSYQYRLTGPGKWDGARNAILTQWDRTLKPLQTRVVDDFSEPTLIPHWLKILLGTPVLFFAVLLAYKSSFHIRLSGIGKLGNRLSTYLASNWKGCLTPK